MEGKHRSYTLSKNALGRFEKVEREDEEESKEGRKEK